MALNLYSKGKLFDTKGKLFDYEKMKSKADAKKKSGEPAKYTFYTNNRGRKVKKINPKWKIWNKNQKNKTTKTENETTKTETKKTATFKESIKAGEELNKTIKASNKKPKYKQVDAEGLKKIQSDIKKKESKKEKLKISPYRRTKGEGIEKKGGGYRGDTRITKKLKKAGFTETRLARLRKDHADWKAKRKKKKKK